MVSLYLDLYHNKLHHINNIQFINRWGIYRGIYLRTFLMFHFDNVDLFKAG